MAIHGVDIHLDRQQRQSLLRKENQIYKHALITQQEFAHLLSLMHVDLSEESVFQLFTSVDKESSGAIDFDEFSLALGSYSQVRT